MSFDPVSMKDDDYRQLLVRFGEARRSVMNQHAGHDENEQLVTWALGGKRKEWSGLGLDAMSCAENRKRIWSLLSAQMESGISSFEAINNIIENAHKLSLKEGTKGVLEDWIKMLQTSGYNHADFFFKYVVPVDGEEGLRLVLGQRLGSFQSIMRQVAEA